MALITDNDIKEMRDRGFDSATIANAEQDLKRATIARELIAQIQQAFQRVVLGDGIGLWEAQGLDDYEDETTCAAYRQKDEKTDWSSIPTETLERCNSSPSFFDADGFRFHLPAFLCADLNEDYGFDFIFALIQFKHLKYDRYTSLSPSQRAVVRSYLLYQRDHPGNAYDRRDIEKALKTYWTEASCNP